MNKKLVIYSSIIFLIIPIFGFKSLLSLFGNILLLLFLVPILFFGIVFLSWNSFRKNIIQCKACGNTIYGLHQECPYCGSKIDLDLQKSSFTPNASEETIEVEAEEII